MSHQELTIFRNFARLWPRRPRNVIALALATFLLTATILFLWLPVQPRWSFTIGLRPHVIGFTPDGRSLLVNSCGWQGPIRVLDTANGRVVSELLTQAWIGTSAPALSPDGTLLACMDGHRLLLVEVPGGQVIKTIRLSLDDARSGECRFSPDGRTLIYKVRDPETTATSLTAWDVASRKERFRLQDEGFPAIFTNDCQCLITGTLTRAPHNPSEVASGKIKLWNAQTGELIRVLNGHVDGVEHLALSSDGKTLASGGWPDGRFVQEFHSSIKLWDTTTWNEIGVVGNQHFPQFMPNGASIVTRTHDLPTRTDSLRFYGARTGQAHQIQIYPILPTGLGFIDCPTPSPDGRIIAMGMGHRAAPSKLREKFGELLGSPSPVKYAAWYELKLYDAVTGENRATIRDYSPDDQLEGLRTLFVPDSTMLATSGFDQVRLWDVPPRQPMSWIIAISMLPAMLVLAPAVKSHLGRKRAFLANQLAPV